MRSPLVPRWLTKGTLAFCTALSLFPSVLATSVLAIGVQSRVRLEVTTTSPGQVTYVPSSTTFACYLIGFPESSTRDDYGVEGNGLGYSFSYEGETWWLFGDSHGTATFNGHPNKSPRYPARSTPG